MEGNPFPNMTTMTPFAIANDTGEFNLGEPIGIKEKADVVAVLIGRLPNGCHLDKSKS